MNNSTAEGTDSPNAPAAAWVRFLRSYGPTPNNHNLFDEYVTGALGRANVKPITLTRPQFDEMKRRLSSAERGPVQIATKASCAAVRGRRLDGSMADSGVTARETLKADDMAVQTSAHSAAWKNQQPAMAEHS